MLHPEFVAQAFRPEGFLVRMQSVDAAKGLTPEGVTYSGKCHYTFAPWHFLYFLPDPQGQGLLRPTFAPARTGFGASACAGPV